MIHLNSQLTPLFDARPSTFNIPHHNFYPTAHARLTILKIYLFILRLYFKPQGSVHIGGYLRRTVSCHSSDGEGEEV